MNNISISASPGKSLSPTPELLRQNRIQESTLSKSFGRLFAYFRPSNLGLIFPETIILIFPILLCYRSTTNGQQSLSTSAVLTSLRRYCHLNHLDYSCSLKIKEMVVEYLPCGMLSLTSHGLLPQRAYKQHRNIYSNLFNRLSMSNSSVKKNKVESKGNESFGESCRGDPNSEVFLCSLSHQLTVPQQSVDAGIISHHLCHQGPFLIGGRGTTCTTLSMIWL